MRDKVQILARLQDEFQRWQTILEDLDEAQIMARRPDAALSLKDEIAHLWAWQQRSIARMRAAVTGAEPQYPDWPAHLDPEAHEDVDRLNAWFYEQYRRRPWTRVYDDWRQSFQQLIDLTQAVPQKDLFEINGFAWLPGYALVDVLAGSLEHHVEHREGLDAGLDRPA